MTRIVTGSDAVISSPLFVGTDGLTPTNPSPAPTCVVTRDSGAAVVFTGPVLVTAGVYTVAIASTALATPDVLTLVWTGEVGGVTQEHTQQVEVAGGVYVPLPELWAMGGLPTTKATLAQIVELREEFEDIAERYTGQAWVPRFARESHPSAAGWVLLGRAFPRSILSAVDVDDIATATTTWVLSESGRVDEATFAVPLTIRYLHGADRPPPSLVEACKDYVRSKALERFGGNRVGRDVLSSSDGQGGSIRYATPDWGAGRPTGYLDVDRALNALGRPLPGVA